MRKFPLKSLTTAAILGMGLLPAGPALATDQATAVEICMSNRACGLSRTPGGVNFWVVTEAGGMNEVHCPDEGECVCISCHPAGTTRQRGDIGYIIRPQMNAPQSLSEQGPSGPAAAPAPQYPTDGPALP